ncbi:MAG: L-threonylcarbamoyladenylate synthase [Treponema sp.]|nr:L-threonylcarbamoyladenylate synthase [Treponema sp.]
MTSRKCEKESAQAAASVLLEGKVAVLPTDTVYGFSALALVMGSTGPKKSGLDLKIDQIKKSPESKPLIELISEPSDIYKYTDQEIPSKILEKWPGALTVLVKNNAWYKALTGREATAFRCPGDEWLRQVISLCGGPIYSTSVNFSGKPVLEAEADILRDFGGLVDFFVLDGDKKNALPSTLVSLLDGEPKVLRQGAVRLD